MQCYADKFTAIMHKAGLYLNSLQVAIKFKDSLPEYYRDRLETAELATGKPLQTSKLITMAITLEANRSHHPSALKPAEIKPAAAPPSGQKRTKGCYTCGKPNCHSTICPSKPANTSAATASKDQGGKPLTSQTSPGSNLAHITCSKCSKKGHYANMCPEKKGPPTPKTTEPAVRAAHLDSPEAVPTVEEAAEAMRELLNDLKDSGCSLHDDDGHDIVVRMATLDLEDDDPIPPWPKCSKGDVYTPCRVAGRQFMV